MNTNKLLFLEQYNDLCDRIKKKFFRRPNYTDVLNEFYDMGKKLMNFHHGIDFAHLIFKKRSECEKSNLRTLYTTQLESARAIMKKEIAEYQFGIQFTGDNYSIATKTYYDIVNLLKETEYKIVAVYLLCELADYSIQLSQYADAISHLYSSLVLKLPIKDTIYYKICYKIVEISIVSKNYHKSYDQINELILNDCEWSTQAYEVSENLKCQIYITKMFLLLYKYPTIHKNTFDNSNKFKELSQIADLEKFINPTLDSKLISDKHMPIDIFWLLRTFILQYNSGNTIALLELEKQLSIHLSDVNSMLIYELLRRHFDPELHQSLI